MVSIITIQNNGHLKCPHRLKSVVTWELNILRYFQVARVRNASQLS